MRQPIIGPRAHQKPARLRVARRPYPGIDALRTNANNPRSVRLSLQTLSRSTPCFVSIASARTSSSRQSGGHPLIGYRVRYTASTRSSGFSFNRSVSANPKAFTKRDRKSRISCFDASGMPDRGRAGAGDRLPTDPISPRQRSRQSARRKEQSALIHDFSWVYAPAAGGAGGVAPPPPPPLRCGAGWSLAYWSTWAFCTSVKMASTEACAA